MSDPDFLMELDLGLPAHVVSESEIAGKMAKRLLDRWFDLGSLSKYGQNTGHIMRELKGFCLKYVVRGGHSEEDVFNSMVRLAETSAPVNSYNLQSALNKVKLDQIKQREAGANQDMLNREKFLSSIMLNTNDDAHEIGGEF